MSFWPATQITEQLLCFLQSVYSDAKWRNAALCPFLPWSQQGGLHRMNPNVLGTHWPDIYWVHGLQGMDPFCFGHSVSSPSSSRALVDETFKHGSTAIVGICSNVYLWTRGAPRERTSAPRLTLYYTVLKKVKRNSWIHPFIWIRFKM